MDTEASYATKHCRKGHKKNRNYKQVPRPFPNWRLPSPGITGSGRRCRHPDPRKLHRAKALEEAAEDTCPVGRDVIVDERPSAGDTPRAPWILDRSSPTMTTAAAGSMSSIQPPIFQRTHSSICTHEAKNQRPRRTETTRHRREDS
jgi:hypothetical protein